jgi:hypothetical protein
MADKIALKQRTRLERAQADFNGYKKNTGNGIGAFAVESSPGPSQGDIDAARGMKKASANDVSSAMKKGGTVKTSFAKRGSTMRFTPSSKVKQTKVSGKPFARGGGIEQRGKTKGKVC